ncbi:MAG: GPW/gp25 family protein [Pseudomonadota bacterium]
MATSKSARLLPPLHYVFAQAHAAGDARRPLDLRDEHGDRIVSGRRGMGRFPVDEQVLRNEVSGNLAAMLNTVHLEASEDLSAVPEVEKSILNYGFPDLSRLTIDDTKINNIAAEIRTALIKYEPRVNPASIQAERDTDVDDASLAIRFVVYAELWGEPLNIPVEYVAEVDSEFAKFRIERR